jgi:hypothetical protein
MQKTKPPTWKELLDREQPLLLPCAHDALSARLIERAGFTAYSIGGFALVGSRYGIPDIGLAAFGEISAGIRDIMAATGRTSPTPSKATRRWARPLFSWKTRWRPSAAATWPART